MMGLQTFMNMISLSVIALMASAVSADVQAGSEFGRLLLSKARLAEYTNANEYINFYEGAKNNYGVYYGSNYYGGNDNGNDNQQEAEWTWYSNYMLLGSTWLSEYSIKFQGCYDTFKWNKEAKDAEDVRLMTRSVVRFRLCPSTTCTVQTTDGCNGNHGDYVIDLASYLQAYVEAKMAFQQWNSFTEADQEAAEENGGNYYQDGFDVLDYMQCTDSGIQIDISEYVQVENNEYAGTNYFIGPYCGEQGGAILMGMFKDDACSIPADQDGGKSTYLEQTGYYLPFSDQSMIEFDCFSCKIPDTYNQNNVYNQQQNAYAYDAQQEISVIQDFCETAYLKSGKCETKLPSQFFNIYKKKNEKACNYIQGIKMIREDGSIVTTHRNSPGHLKAKATETVLLSVFGSALLVLSVYVYHLKTKFDKPSIDLPSHATLC